MKRTVVIGVIVGVMAFLVFFYMALWPPCAIRPACIPPEDLIKAKGKTGTLGFEFDRQVVKSQQPIWLTRTVA
jgi:hypothetical protein